MVEFLSCIKKKKKKSLIKHCIQLQIITNPSTSIQPCKVIYRQCQPTNLVINAFLKKLSSSSMPSLTPFSTIKSSS